jgi:hypothetical protein
MTARGSALAAAIAILGGSSCTTAGPQSPKLMARCRQMHALWVRDAQDYAFHQAGQRAQAELALYECQNGQYDSGLRELERLLRRELVPVPPE